MPVTLPETWADWFTLQRVFSILLLLLGWVLARAAGQVVGRIASSRASAQHAMILQRFVYYGLVVLAVLTALSGLGVDLSVLLGAAGVLTVAVGFASQTSASNLISGLFLLFEQPFVVGDVVGVGAHIGEVVSIDLLSVKLRTFDNLLLRIPNETLLKSDIRNLTRFPIRRFDLVLTVPYTADLKRVSEVLVEAAREVPVCLDEPEPKVIFQGFVDHGVSLQLSVWASTTRFLDLRNGVPGAVLAHLKQAGISIPLPQRVLHRADDMESP
jgi:small-conductance mechanosensitive channel